jgi:hypothetical protein
MNTDQDIASNAKICQKIQTEKLKAWPLSLSAIFGNLRRFWQLFDPCKSVLSVVRFGVLGPTIKLR